MSREDIIDFRPRPWVFHTRTRPRMQDHRGVSGSVLIVDDDPDFRLLAGSLLADCGLVVVAEAVSVATGLSTGSGFPYPDTAVERR
jgi:hypothetical protein